VRSLPLLAALLAAACAPAFAPTPASAPAPALLSDPDEYRDRPVSRAAGETYFAETGLGDPYATGFPYPVMLAMLREYPDDLGADFRAFAAKFGFLANDDADALPIGFHLTIDPITRTPFVMMNCQTCHAERLRLPNGELFVSGLGNKRVRMHAYDAALMRIASDPALTESRILPLAREEATRRGVAFPAEYARAIVRATIANLRRRAALRGAAVARLDRAMPGRVATIESFAIALETAQGHVATVPRDIGWSRIPDVRNARYKDTLSFDGAGKGALNALAVEADIAAGARVEWFDGHRHIGTSLAMFLRSFDRKLPFPGAIDPELARRGHDLFVARCAGCHGRYEAGGAIAYKEKVVPLAIVGTDPARANAVTPEFAAAANAVPIAKGLTHVAPTGGYVAPPLVDAWARAPFGHAGQWPSLAALATKPDARPRRFVVLPSASYDLDSVGVRVREGGAAAPGIDEYVYDATLQGFDVGGHPFLAELGDASAKAVIEYVKTL
jgi:mono/diheme cytochrome c family protein